MRRHSTDIRLDPAVYDLGRRDLAEINVREQEWKLRGLCQTFPAWWMPEDAESRLERAQFIEWAKATCDVCPVQAQCLTWAIEQGEEFGIWGGKTAEERQRMRRRAKRLPGQRGGAA